MRRLPVILFLLLVVSLPATAQQFYNFNVLKNGKAQEFTGTLSTPEDVVQILMLNMDVGDTIYTFVQAGGTLDPVAVVFSAQDTKTPLIVDDNGGGGKNPLLQYKVTARGDYIVGVWSLEGAGDFRAVSGINTPAVLAEAVSDTTFNNDLGSAASFSCDSVTPAERPVLADEQRIERPDFIVHYTLSGQDATTQAFADTLTSAIETSLQKQHEFGWVNPIPDCGEGGDTRFDVYMLDMGEGYFGSAEKDNPVGDNPATPARELNAWYAHLLIDNDMVFQDYDPVQQLKVTAAHELHHTVQYGYDGLNPYYGFFEGGAIWMQEQIFPGDPLMVREVRGMFVYPDVCPWSIVEDDTMSPRYYGEWLTIDSLVRDLGAATYEKIWESLILNQGLTGYYKALSAAGTTPQMVIDRMAIRNLLHDYAAATDAWDTVAIEATATDVGSYHPRATGVQELGVDYVHVTAPPGVYAFDLGGGNLSMTLVGIDSVAHTATAYDMRLHGVIDTTPYSDVYVLILNTDEPVTPDTCQYTSWTLNISDGTGYGLSQPMPDAWNAAKFKR